MSFHGRGSAVAGATAAGGTGQLRRPKTLPNLSAAARIQATSPQAEGRPKMTKVLLNVTIQGSLGPVQVLLTLDSTVADLIAAAVRLYVKEGRRPVLPVSKPAAYDLHYSQFSLESLNRDELLVELGSRNFFLCKRREDAETGFHQALANSGGVQATSSSPSSCSKQAEGRRTGFGLPWLKLMGFLQ